MELGPARRTTTRGRPRRHAELVLPDSGSRTLWFESEPGATVSDRADAFVLASLMTAMHLGTDLHVRDPLSRVLLDNVEVFQRLVLEQCPGRFRHVDVIPDAVVEPVTSLGGTATDAAADLTASDLPILLLASGGVDATWTLHRLLRDGVDPTRVTGVVVAGLGGFPLYRPRRFRDDLAALRREHDHLGVRTRVAVTNIERSTQVAGIDPYDVYAPRFLSCLHAVATEPGIGVIASGISTAAGFRGCGSKPATDERCASDELRIVHHGAGHSRIEKLADLARWRTDVTSIRVCNHPRRRARNCGVCEKCVRTAIAGRLAGADGVGGIELPPAREVEALHVPDGPARASWVHLATAVHELGGLDPDLARAVDHAAHGPGGAPSAWSWFAVRAQIAVETPVRHLAYRDVRRVRAG